VSINPQNAFNLLLQAKAAGHLSGFGTTYILTILFFLTHGQQPIYNRFVHKAAQAIATNTSPKKAAHHQPVMHWAQYLNYQAQLAPVGAALGLAMPVNRSVDRALWVYGHLFP